mgnify:CR=1 FL=1
MYKFSRVFRRLHHDFSNQFSNPQNKEYADKWPNITVKGEAPADADEFNGVEGKYEKYFTANPGKGDA